MQKAAITMTAGGHFRTSSAWCKRGVSGISGRFRVLNPLALPFNVTMNPPRLARVLARWERNHNQLNWALAPDGVAVLYSSPEDT
jgi:hypothetical protein